MTLETGIKFTTNLIVMLDERKGFCQNNLINSRAGCSGNTGTQTDALTAGGLSPSIIAYAEGYDGTSWSTRPSLATARKYVAGFGTSSSAVVAGGATPSYQNATEEFTGDTTTDTASTIDFD